MNRTTTKSLLPLLLLAVPLAIAGCATSDTTEDGGTLTSGGEPPGGSPTSGSPPGSPPASPPASDCVGGSRVTVTQAGSSTVLPIAERWAEDFGRCIGANMVVSGGGSSAGIQRFCRGEVDIADASRPIKSSETSACRAAGIEPVEMQVAIDALAIVVSSRNTFAQDITVEELNKIYSADGSKNVDHWDEVRAGWPHERIQIFAPGTDSGTYDYFREVAIRPFDGSSAEGRSPAQGVTVSEDDNVLVNGISGSPYAIGYFGLAYVTENSNRVRALAVDDGKDDNGAGPQAPTSENVVAGSYQPFARPLYMYVDGNPTGVLGRYFERALSDHGQDLVEEVGYIRLPEDLRQEMLAKVG